MRRKGQEVYIDPKRGICMIILQKSPISQEKRRQLCIDLQRTENTGRWPLGTPLPVGRKQDPVHTAAPAGAGRDRRELTAYRIKGQKDYYFSTHPSGNPPHYGTGPSELHRFKVAFSWLWEAYMQRRVVFEERLCEILLLKYLT